MLASRRRLPSVSDGTARYAAAFCLHYTPCGHILRLSLKLINSVPVVPTVQHGGGQVPLQGLQSSLPSPAVISPPFLPTYPSLVYYSSSSPQDTPTDAPDASHDYIEPTIDIPIVHQSHEQRPIQASASSSVSREGTSSEADIQMRARKTATAAAGTFLSLLTFSQIYQRLLFSRITPVSEREDESTWVASSNSWLDRKTCSWFGFCGVAHLNKAKWTTARQQEALVSDPVDTKVNLTEFWESANTNPEDWSDDERILREIPDYVLEHAPYIHLYSGEEFWPCDIAEHLIHTTPHLNYTTLSDHPNLTHLDDLNNWGRFVYLQSDDNVEDRPEWLGGETNIPTTPDDSDAKNWADWEELGDGQFIEDTNGEKEDWFSVGHGDTTDKGGIRHSAGAKTAPVAMPTLTAEDEQLLYEYDLRSEAKLSRRNKGKKVVGGRSDAPVVLLVVEKDDGVVDAFFFFFYSYNLGNKVFNVRFGNHVGDWEHTTVRFQHGEPKAIFFSEHNFGKSYLWNAVEKIGKRPVGYSATGTHAMYGTPGVHPYVLPGGILHDVTDRGPLWDPLLNLKSYTYDYRNDILRSSNLNPQAPIGWFYFEGRWGDKFYPLSDSRQYRFVGQYHYVDGPQGPRYKNLGRSKICQGNEECVLESWERSQRDDQMEHYPDLGEGELVSEGGLHRLVGPELDSGL